MSTAIQLFTGPTDDLLLQAQAFGVAIKPSDERLVASAAGTPIRDIAPQKMVDKSADLLIGIFRSLGMHKEPDPIDGAEFMGYLQRWFASMTVADVRQAFEYYAVGELDRWLMDDKGAALKHYQQFAPAFYSKVLKAYQKQQAEVKKAVSAKVGDRMKEEDAKNVDPIASRVTFLEHLRTIALELAALEEPTYLLPTTAEWILFKLKIIGDDIEITKDDIDTARVLYQKNKGTAVAVSIGNAMKAGVVPEEVHVRARNLALRRMFRQGVIMLGADEVAKRFDWAIEQTRAKLKQ